MLFEVLKQGVNARDCLLVQKNQEPRAFKRRVCAALLLDHKSWVADGIVSVDTNF